MNSSPSNRIPDNERIERLLGKFKPHPTTRFQRTINAAPWQKYNQTRIQRNNILFSKRNALRIFALVSVIAMIGTLSIPSLRAIARQIFFSFINAPDNTLEVQVNLDNPAELFHYADPSNFTQSIEQAEKLSGFEIKEPTDLPVGLLLVGARYDHSYSAVTILYQAHDYKLFLTQRKVNRGKDVFSIGSTAQIEIVSIGDYQGEFVMGGWKAISTEAVSPSQQRDPGLNINAVWDHELAQYTLRWHMDGYAYELRAIGVGSPSRSELIFLADGLK